MIDFVLYKLLKNTAICNMYQQETSVSIMTNVLINRFPTKAALSSLKSCFILNNYWSEHQLEDN